MIIRQVNDGIILYDLGQLPSGGRHGEYEASPLEPYFKDITSNVNRIKVIFYWYGCGSYEGTGEAIALFENGKWGTSSLSHCSCNGPDSGLADLRPEYGWQEENDARKTFSGEAWRDVSELLEIAMSEGYLNRSAEAIEGWEEELL